MIILLSFQEHINVWFVVTPQGGGNTFSPSHAATLIVKLAVFQHLLPFPKYIAETYGTV